MRFLKNIFSLISLLVISGPVFAQPVKPCEMGATQVVQSRESLSLKLESVTRGLNRLQLKFTLIGDMSCLVDVKPVVELDGTAARQLSPQPVRGEVLFAKSTWTQSLSETRLVIDLSGPDQVVARLYDIYSAGRSLYPYLKSIKIQFLAKYSAAFQVVYAGLLQPWNETCASQPEFPMNCNKYEGLQFHTSLACLSNRGAFNDYVKAVRVTDPFAGDDSSLIQVHAVDRNLCFHSMATTSFAEAVAPEILIKGRGQRSMESATLLSQIVMEVKTSW